MAVIVEGNPQNYHSRCFVTSAPFGILASPNVGLPVPECLCLMVKELVPMDWTAYKANWTTAFMNV